MPTNTYILINPKYKDDFMEFIFSMGFTWLRYQVDRLANALKDKVHVEVTENPYSFIKGKGEVFYLVGYKLPDTQGDIIFNTREDWPAFKKVLKTAGIDLNILLKNLE
jgi:hypothetical protein